MPYCPKCDIEFVDGITVCSDCGGPLVESEEVAKAMKQKEQEEKITEEFFQDEHSSLTPEEILQKKQKELADNHVYVKKSQKYEDLKSSASAFYLLGAGLVIAGLLGFAGVIPLPGSPVYRIILQTALTVFGILCLVLAVSTTKSASRMTKQIEEENNVEKDLLNWFSEHYTPQSLDEQLSNEISGLSLEETALKRMNLIQDILITQFDIGDQSYADSMAEEIYTRLYEN